MRRMGVHGVFVLGVAGVLAFAAATGRAQTDGGTPAPVPAAKGGAADAGMGTTAPNFGGVKDVMKDAVKGALALPGSQPAAPAAAPPAAPAVEAAAAPADPATAAANRLAMLRRKTLKDEDFLENDDRNRDPFRSFLRLFTSKEGPKTPKVPAIFEKFALEELALIAIISGDQNPRAMFRDPGGLGQTLKRGDYISKAAARVSKILSDRVILELNELTPTGETRTLEKAVLVNPEGAQR